MRCPFSTVGGTKRPAEHSQSDMHIRCRMNGSNMEFYGCAKDRVIRVRRSKWVRVTFKTLLNRGNRTVLFVIFF